ncbi:MAG: hypothetical protein SNJ73_06335, partial [Acetobacteraceae bacterium]
MIRLRGIAAALLLAAAPQAAPAQAPQRPPAAAAQQAVTFLLKNEGAIAVYELYVARGGAGARGWGPDRLGDRVVEPGEEFRVRLPPGFGCSADIRIVYVDREEEIRERVDICREREIVAARSLPAQAERDVAVTNAGPRTVMFLYIRPAGDRDWGEDRLGADTVEPGRTFNAAVPDTGCVYDVRVEYDNDSAEERRGVDLCDVPALTIAPGWILAEDLASFRPGAAGTAVQAEPRLALVNRTGRTVFTVHVFPDGARSEGPDRLGTGTLDDGERIAIALEPGRGCLFTLRIAYVDGTREERSGIDLCGSGEITLEPGWVDAPPAGRVRFVNQGPAPIVALHVDAPGAPRGPDRLGDGVLGVGRSLPLAPPQEGICGYDVTALFRNGAEARIAGADLCAGDEIVLAP